MSLVYSFIANPGTINQVAFGFLNLSSPNRYLALLAGAAQFWQTRMMMTKKPEIKSEGSKDENMMATMNKQMMYMMPALTVFIGFTLPGGLTFYWFLTTLFTVFQQHYLFNKKTEKKLEVVK